MKIPRDLKASQLIKLLEKIDYFETRQARSHIRLTKKTETTEHHISIPNHDPIKLGTLNSILNDLSQQMKISKLELLALLFE